ncbi:hypothetical protein LTR37_012148 [Vermiconidia calcicola]|uniref:Uncharacterized protein n=1 Tax=Vermiconidia calcicola TaxID=1690605 RepID=A0ACC3N085_9PEZI|nr:hypothetical protein LTR37_012148 [Vermiconidia calcicola]
MALTSQGADLATTTLDNKDVEMSELPPAAAAADPSLQHTEPDATAGAPQTDASSPTAQQEAPCTKSSTLDPPNRLARLQSEALGPATELPIAPSASSERGPTLSITLMLTTGARHPYKIDEKYLRTRKVETTGGNDFDPREISGYKLKELIWTDWRSEWEPRPASPSAIRLIILGRMVEDKSALKDFPFKLDAANVVHMTVKPADFLDDDEGTGGKGTGKGHSIRGRDGEERSAGCRCVIL